MKIKNYLLLSTFLVCTCIAKAQDYKKVFFNLDQQPNINSFVSTAATDDYVSLLVSYTVSGTKYAYLKVYDGTTWFSTDSFVYSGSLNRVLAYNNNFWIFGEITSIDGKAAPSGKCISLLSLKNNTWDSVNNSILPDSVNFKAAVCNDEGIYMHSESSKKLSEIFLYKPASGITATYKVLCNMPNYGSVFIFANAKRCIAYANAGTVVSVNGNSVGKLFAISNGVVSTPSGLNGGNMLAASVDVNGDIIYNTDIGSLMNRWNGTSSQSIEYNLGSKVFGAASVICTDDALFLPGILNGSTNTMYVLERNGSTWYTINFYKTSELLVYSKNLGTFNVDYKTFEVSKLEQASLIQGKIFHDKDSNCVMGSGENGTPFQYISYKDGSLKLETISDENGDYYLAVPIGKYQLDKLASYVHFGTCSIQSDSIFRGQIDTINIPVRAKRAREVDVVLLPGGSRWGDPSTQTIVVRNLGNESRTLDLKFRIPDNVTYVSSSPSGTVANKQVQWSVSLSGLEVKRYSVKLHLDTGKSKPNDSLYLHVWLENYGTDDDTLNNRDRVVKLIRAAYDPNSKQSIPEGDVKQLVKPILYTINFQNLGNDFARHVIVKDTLDKTLDLETIEILGSSHPVNVELENGILTFSFNNIHLDYAANNVEASKGWVTFRIRAKRGLVINTIVPNKASIYFDFNSAIITNTASIRLVENQSRINSVYSTSNIKLYPNPVADILHIESLQKDGLASIYNINGVMVFNGKIEIGNPSVLDVSSFSPGIYILVIGSESTKFIVE